MASATDLFQDSSSRRLDRFLDHIANTRDPAEKRRCTDMYKHLSNKQREALLSGEEAAREAFEREYLACAPAFGFCGGAAQRPEDRDEQDSSGFDDDGSAPEPPTEEQREEFRRTVKTFFKTYDDEKDLRRRATELASIRKRLEEAIVVFMRRFDIEDVDTREGKLRCIKCTTRGAPNRADMEERIRVFFGEDTNAAEALRGNLFERKEAVERTALRRIAPRAGAAAASANAAIGAGRA